MNTSPLTAMFWKESRENLRWAVLALLALSLGLIYAWSRLPSVIVPGQVWGGENLVLTITTPLIGLALGLMQILPELRRDQWAFLVHRPASRTTLFWGKVLPGVSLYLAATVLPLLGLAAWAAQPSHVPAPFDFRFTLAGWSSILAGLPFYFAGLLVALRPARWYGSRGLPLLTALLSPWAAVWFGEFWQVALICLVVTLVLLGAAWGSFVSGGEYKEQTKSARFALGLTLYPAMVAIALGALLLAATVLNTISRPKPTYADWSQTEYKIDVHGQIFKDATHHDSQGQTHETITDAAGHRIEPNHQQPMLINLSYLFLSTVSQYSMRYSDTSRYVIDLESTYDSKDRSRTYWYYQTAARQIVGYTVHRPTDILSNAQFSLTVTYLGPDGYGPHQAQAGQFEDAKPDRIGLLGRHLLRFSRSVYLYDLLAPVPTVRLLQLLPGGRGGDTLLSQVDSSFVDSRLIYSPPGSSYDINNSQILIVVSGQQVTAYTSRAAGASSAPSQLFTIRTNFDPGSYTSVGAAVTPDQSRFFFLYQPGSVPGPYRFMTVTSTGKIVGSGVLPAPEGNQPSSNFSYVQAIPALLVPPLPVSAWIAYGGIGSHLGQSSNLGMWDLRTDCAIGLFSALGGLVAAGMGWLISRRLGDGRRGQIAWAVGCFWLGGYGVLLLLALRAGRHGFPARTAGGHGWSTASPASIAERPGRGRSGMGRRSSTRTAAGRQCLGEKAGAAVPPVLGAGGRLSTVRLRLGADRLLP